MRLHNDCLPYLDGTQFSSSYDVAFEFDTTDWTCPSRLDVLCNMAAGKRVIHVGCVDHTTGKVDHKLKHNQWLHKLLCDRAKQCVGIDILSDCIDYIRDGLGYDDVYSGNILEDDLLFLDGSHWDSVMLPEVVEHLDNPVDFLTRLRERIGDQIGEVIISVPNAFSQVYSQYATRGSELINTDHRYSFTPYTLAKIAHVSGYEVGDITMCCYGRLSRRRILRNWQMKRQPLRRDDIVMRVTPRR